MKRIGAAKFKAQCLAILDELGPEGLIVTKHGKPVARVLPIPKDGKGLIGVLEHEIRITGEIMSTGADWDAAD